MSATRCDAGYPQGRSVLIPVGELRNRAGRPVGVRGPNLHVELTRVGVNRFDVGIPCVVEQHEFRDHLGGADD
ncbi:MAG: hypothetical protein H0U00_12760 [Actinobacteria bacterium]|nr:hypothetical protein [Actinomycetota bacterium]